MSTRLRIETNRAPKPVGPYSQGIVNGDLIFTAQIGLDPATDKLAGDDIESQTRQTLENIAAILEAAGTSLDSVVKVTMYLRNIGDFAAVNKTYAEFFPVDPPARATLQAAGLPLDALIEIECVAGR